MDSSNRFSALTGVSRLKNVNQERTVLPEDQVIREGNEAEPFGVFQQEIADLDFDKALSIMFHETKRDKVYGVPSTAEADDFRILFTTSKNDKNMFFVKSTAEIDCAFPFNTMSKA